jgi:Fur family ferric uptake transcriptional regulator
VDHGLELQKAGLRSTLARVRLLELFHARPEQGFSAEARYRALLAAGHPLPLPSIYRTLPQLEKAGLLRRGELAEQRGVFLLEDGGATHDQLICTDCGRAERIADPEIDGRLRALATQRGFRAGKHVLALHAACARPRCEHRPARNSAPRTTDVES